ncbi:MAG: hypothetical protein A3A96_04045 [Candidatus Zambryskibacteria bacterium RIFCSPLOWO2_01_FULL_39_39]|uniref:dihydrofolate reductase n=1 Tax=Candidatus Zambryskibacteria bacterium RIFCSPLOWO2_01_FULL_39_39 TaxID=1802758 RepID=A0A1G2TZB4_9BACT|nr:MAG: hypothetical protein A2644_03630 [Candidatus Zambryskibacteria bacterium RIFCSPHIGHO2_01_FULL_39_63]OHA94691.1 MAG: hypothetical protein A3B88_00435 [Candidatus Zambryskibacteria bacterium RIFCSPHIGHO2_02_FULL_39_19]OHA98132.1 MAG: hypothetical protein A3F20_01335 [Candidatus Zambryskibacteria bacterium RIFCSPHIGHO2_12_FULL_39_21]OHB02584.1 MAG: hypothetical protein A3A96_04045 [Candidatus Zambryskibacteria bacterium RIFCSPLOWO2_01_FULL_39_39]
MPWRGKVPSDMKRFVELTVGHSVVMGRKTWDSIPFKFRPLPNRQNIVLTRNPQFTIENSGVIVAHSLEEAVQQAKSETVWIIGGAEIYALALPVTDFLHTTILYEKFEGDAFFPKYNLSDWMNIYFKRFKAGEAGAEKDTINSGYLIFKRK